MGINLVNLLYLLSGDNNLLLILENNKMDTGKIPALCYISYLLPLLVFGIRNGMLIRLGETHCSCCHPERETTLMLLHQLPYHDNRPDPSNPYCLWRKFTQTITLPLIPQTINPFLTAEEKAAEEEMMGLGRLKSGMRKYFIPEKSYVRTLD